MPSIDINCDMGESFGPWVMGQDLEILPHVTSANIACGGHAGDEHTMKSTIEQARRWKLALGAHPGYPDRPNFGRLELQMPLAAIADSIFEQVTALDKVAAHCGAGLVHVKPHGALYNVAVHNAEVARAIGRGDGTLSSLRLMTLPSVKPAALA